MNVTEYTYLLNHPNAVNEKQSKTLETLVENFPYFQSARALYLKGLYNQDSYKYNLVLKQTAAHTTDRSVLFDFITSDEFTIIDKNIYEQKLAQLLEIEVKDDILIPSEEKTSSVKTLPENITEEKTPETESSLVETLAQSEEKTSDSIETLPENITEEKTPETESFSTETETLEISAQPEETLPENITEEKTPETESFSTETETPEISAQPEEKLPEPEFESFTENINFIPDFSSEIEPAETKNDIITKPVTQSEEKTETKEIGFELEAKLEIGKPLSFSPNEKHSFQEWLQLTRFKPISREDSQKAEESEKKNESIVFEQKNDKSKKLELIDKFIESNPKIIPSKENLEPAKTLEIPDTSHLMTETLARVYLEQKKYQKAIQAYEILILKYPEKSVFFADRIKDIKNLQQNNQ